MVVIELYHIAVLHFLYTEKEETYMYQGFIQGGGNICNGIQSQVRQTV